MVSIINVFLIFFNMLVDMGIGPALIQNKTLQKNQIDGVYSFTVLLSVCIAIIFAGLAKPISLFYDNPELVGVTLAMSLALFSSGLNMVPQAVLLKQKRFLEINLAQILSSLSGGSIAVILAWMGFSYYALVINTIVKNMVMFFFTYRKSGLNISKKIQKESLAELYGFSRNQFLFNLINYFSRNLDHFLIGKYISIKALGYYDKAYTLSLYPNQVLTSVITPVIQPVLSAYEEQKQVIKNTYLTISRLLALVGLPLTVFLIFSAEEIILILFGNQWGESVLTFRILAMSIWIQLIMSSTGSIFQSSNRTDLMLLSGVLSTVLNILGIIIGILTGKIEMVALCLVTAFFINFIQCNYLLMKKVFRGFQWEFYRILPGPFLLAIIVMLPLLIMEYFVKGLPNIISLAIKGIVSLVMYVVGLKMTGTLKEVVRFFKRQGEEKP